MAPTKAQRTKSGRKNYGRNYDRGRSCEEKIARSLRGAGWSASLSPGSRGWDITAKKNGRTRRIQVKCLSSRRINSAEVARTRIAHRPWNIKKIPAGAEVWVYDADGRRYILRGPS